MCLAQIIPRLTLFWLTTVFRPKNAFICLCQRNRFLAQLSRWCFFGYDTKKNRIHSRVFFASFPFTYTMYMPQHMPFFQISHVYQGIDIPLFCHRRRVYAASVYISCLFGYKPKKMVVTVGLQNIISMYITLKTSYVFILCLYYLKIKLTGFCQCRPMYINCGAAIVPFITRVYACKIQSA